jgi:hypothetical protein
VLALRGTGARLLGAAALVVASSLAGAQSYCIPQASGVPALSGAPQWWNAGAGEPNYWPRLDDPRWRGALARSFGTGANEHVSFRALRDGSSVYLSWFVKVDPNLDPFIDSLRVAFRPGGGANEALIEVFPFTNAAANLVAAVPPSTITQTRAGTSGAWASSGNEPDWLSTAAGFTRVWLDIATNVWAINMRVPIDPDYEDGINLSNDFSMWFELQVSLPAGGITYYRLDDAITYDDIQGGASSNSWPQFNRTLAPGAAGCLRGVSIASADLGTKFVDSGGVARPNRIDVNGTNTFFAHPLNETGANIPASQIQATFRIANWGTQPDWNDVVDPTNSLWKQINPSTVTNPGAIANGAKADAAGNEMTFNWTLTAGERCAFTGQTGVPGQVAGNPACPNANPERRLHQCMLVELSGGGYDYTPASVYRNMDFVDASEFTREAQVSAAGVAPLPGVSARDVYLYLKTYNLPKDVKAAKRPDLLIDIEKVWPILKRGEVTATHAVAAVASTAVLADPKKRPVRPPMNVQFDILSQLYSTYVVHGYHDTGKKVTVRNATWRVMRPQSSFGYFVHHDGSLAGWDSALNGAQQIAPNYYLVEAPEGGAKQIHTGITARPEKKRGCGSMNLAAAGATSAGLGLMGLFAYWPLRRRRQRD